MNLVEYIENGKKDHNLFWRLSSGEHQNLLDEALEKIENLEEINSSERSVHAEVMEGDSRHSGEQEIKMLTELQNEASREQLSWRRERLECKTIHDQRYCEGQETAYYKMFISITRMIEKLRA